MGQSQLLAWLHFLRIEPWHERRADIHSALLRSLLANVNRDTKKRPRPYTVDDFAVRWEPKRVEGRKPVTSVSQWEATKAQAKAMFPESD